jgi:hypothetical protein
VTQEALGDAANHEPFRRTLPSHWRGSAATDAASFQAFRCPPCLHPCLAERVLLPRLRRQPEAVRTGRPWLSMYSRVHLLIAEDSQITASCLTYLRMSETQRRGAPSSCTTTLRGEM